MPSSTVELGSLLIFNVSLDVELFMRIYKPLAGMTLRISLTIANYLMPTTIDSGPASLSTWVFRKPASRIQDEQSLPV